MTMAMVISQAMNRAAPSPPNAAGLKQDALRERLALFGLCSPALIMMLVIMVIPVGWLFWLSFVGDDGQFSFAHYQRLIDSKSYYRTFVTTFQVSVVTTGVCILIGYPLAYMLSQLPKKIAGLCLITVLLPFWTSLLVRTYAWLVILQRKGILNTWGMDMGLWDKPLHLVHNFTGTVLGMVHIMAPFLILPVYGSMLAINRDYVKAAANLGAKPAQAFWQIFFPLSLPGLFAGTLIVFVLCLGFYVTPAVLGGGKVIMIAMRITTNIELFFNWGAASALGVVLLVLTLAILFAASRFLRIERLVSGGSG